MATWRSTLVVSGSDRISAARTFARREGQASHPRKRARLRCAASDRRICRSATREAPNPRRAVRACRSQHRGSEAFVPDARFWKGIPMIR